MNSTQEGVLDRPWRRTGVGKAIFVDDGIRSMKTTSEPPPYMKTSFYNTESKHDTLKETLHWMEKGNGYVFRAAKSHFESKPVEIQGEPVYAREKIKLSADLDVSGTVPHIPDMMKKDPKYTIGVDFNSKGEPISRVQIAMGEIPYGGVDVKIDEVSMPHYGTYSEYDMGAYYNEKLAKGDMLR